MEGDDDDVDLPDVFARVAEASDILVGDIVSDVFPAEVSGEVAAVRAAGHSTPSVIGIAASLKSLAMASANCDLLLYNRGREEFSWLSSGSSPAASGIGDAAQQRLEIPLIQSSGNVPRALFSCCWWFARVLELDEDEAAFRQLLDCGSLDTGFCPQSLDEVQPRLESCARRRLSASERELFLAIFLKETLSWRVWDEVERLVDGSLEARKESGLRWLGRGREEDEAITPDSFKKVLTSWLVTKTPGIFAMEVLYTAFCEVHSRFPWAIATILQQRSKVRMPQNCVLCPAGLQRGTKE